MTKYFMWRSIAPSVDTNFGDILSRFPINSTEKEEGPEYSGLVFESLDVIDLENCCYYRTFFPWIEFLFTYL
jgi:hypothetical protein